MTEGVSILIYVEPKSLECYLADANDERTFNGSYAILENKMDMNADATIRKMCGTLSIDNAELKVRTRPEDLSYCTESPIRTGCMPLLTSARAFYKSIGTIRPLNQNIDAVIFNRIGWRHITRRSRSKLRILQSFQLLGVALRIIHDSRADVELMRREERPDGTWDEMYRITASVSFSHRHAAVVQVVLLKRNRSGKNEFWFYSVFEKRRRMGLRGEPTPISVAARPVQLPTNATCANAISRTGR